MAYRSPLSQYPTQLEIFSLNLGMGMRDSNKKNRNVYFNFIIPLAIKKIIRKKVFIKSIRKFYPKIHINENDC